MTDIHEELPDIPDSYDSASHFQHNRTLHAFLNHRQWAEILLRELRDRRVYEFPSIFHFEEDPAPSVATYRQSGHKKALIVSDPAIIRKILINEEGEFSNLPYAELGDRTFMLAIDPHTSDGKNRHSSQKKFISELLNLNSNHEELVNRSIEHAISSNLGQSEFDLADLSAEVAVRLCGLWYGFASKDHLLIKEAALAGYHGLTYINLERHFIRDETVIPRAKRLMAQLHARTSALICEYGDLQWRAREYSGNLKRYAARARLPEGVDPLGDWGLSSIGRPLLRRIAESSETSFTVSELSSMVVGLIVGTVGNVQAATCLQLQRYFENEKSSNKGQFLASMSIDDCPPVAFLARRANTDFNLNGIEYPKNTDVLLCLSAASLSPSEHYHGLATGDPGSAKGGKPSQHRCLGASLGTQIVERLVKSVIKLPSLAEVMNPVTGTPKGLQRRLNFACTEYRLTYERSVCLTQQPLNVRMRVKTPVALHASAIARVISVGIPRIQKALRNSQHVYFAWFQLLDSGKILSLHTVYDGNFDAYIQHFALEVDDLFDKLFEHIDGAPPLPIRENSAQFVEVIRANNYPTLGNYFYSALPDKELTQLIQAGEN